MNKFVKTGFVATAALVLSLVGFGEVYGYGGRGGGGGGVIRSFIPLTPAGEVADLHINDDAAKTSNKVVTLDIDSNNATGMAISNTSDFADSVVVPFSSTTSWTLSEGDGEKTIYVKLYKNGAKSFILKKTITLQSAPKEVLGEQITEIEGLLSQVQFGTKNDTVKALQDALKAKGFFPAGIPSTGFYGPITKSAVEKYLASKSVNPSPAPAPVSTDMDALLLAVQFGMKNDTVKVLQDALKAKGFFPVGIPSTGFYGPITKSAVEKYLASKNS